MADLKGLREDLAQLRWDVWTSFIDFKLRRRERRLTGRDGGAGCPQRRPHSPGGYDVEGAAEAVVREHEGYRALVADVLEVR